MSRLQSRYREFANPAVLHRLLQPLPVSLLRQAGERVHFDKWARKITFIPYFRMFVLLALTRYTSLTQLQKALHEDPLFALHGARMEVSVSALAQVPERRGSAAFLELLGIVLEHVAALPHTRRRGRALTTATLREIQELLVRTHIMDSGTFRLPPAVAKWAQTQPTAAGFKLHLRLAEGYGGLDKVLFSPAREHDRRHAEALAEGAEPGSIFLIDRGYLDYRLFDEWTSQGKFFVSKLKRGHAAEVTQERDLGEQETPSGYVLLAELRVRLGSEGQETQHEYRLLDVRTPDGKETTLVTNHWEATPEQLCGLYRYRWTIEIVFRWLKHTLGLSHLVSTKREGVIIQVVMALVVYALLTIYQEGLETWSPTTLLVRIEALTHWALIIYGYELGQAGVPLQAPT